MPDKDRDVLYCVTGLPRSGSTLLMNLLGQNPAHHVTPTSDVVNLLVAVKNIWHGMMSFRAAGYDNVAPRIKNVYQAMLHAFYEEEISNGQTVFDKSRHWMENAEMLEEIVDKEIKMIVCVRDIRDIVASFEKLHLRHPLNRHGLYGQNVPPTSHGRAVSALNADSGVVGRPVAALMDMLDRGWEDNMIVVKYLELTNEPLKVLNTIHNELGLPKFDYDPDHVDQITKEDDSLYGLPLHEIRNKVEPGEEESWKEVLNKATAEAIGKEYERVNKLAEYKKPMRKRIKRKDMLKDGEDVEEQEEATSEPSKPTKLTRKKSKASKPDKPEPVTVPDDSEDSED